MDLAIAQGIICLAKEKNYSPQVATCAYFASTLETLTGDTRGVARAVERLHAFGPAHFWREAQDVLDAHIETKQAEFDMWTADMLELRSRIQNLSEGAY